MKIITMKLTEHYNSAKIYTITLKFCQVAGFICCSNDFPETNTC